MMKTTGKDIIPLLISIILIIISIGITLTTDYIMNYKHYIAIGLVGISTLLYFKNKTLYIYLFGLTLVIGTLNLFEIFIFRLTFGFGSIEFNLIFLILLIIFLTLNKELLNKMFSKKNEDNEDLIKHYERKFESKSEWELKNIADEKSGYVNEAQIASKNVLKNKYMQ